jgi:hypothetical protein
VHLRAVSRGSFGSLHPSLFILPVVCLALGPEHCRLTIANPRVHLQVVCVAEALALHPSLFILPVVCLALDLSTVG